ncbi:hypothetical protein E2C01_000453 [Portunus trituberculatus]|uniref:Uncharacterized protein n=1 Tax=Portunus trituberculatus TaxID=210409 RepID=A0A5B7CEZ6_PORTR|nr:hypothetical protein [Portunus trituberculatus]
MERTTNTVPQVLGGMLNQPSSEAVRQVRWSAQLMSERPPWAIPSTTAATASSTSTAARCLRRELHPKD